MPSTFPGAIDSFTDPLANSSLASPSHSTLHSDINDAVEKVEAFMGLVKVTSATFTSVTEILLDNVFTSMYRNYLLSFDAQSSLGGGIFQIQVRSAGSTISTATYQYQAIDADSTTLSGRRNTAQGSIRFGANDASGYHSAQVQIFCPQIAIPTRTISSFLRNNGNISEQVWGTNTNTTSYDGMRISVTTGNMTGFYSLYGYRN